MITGPVRLHQIGRVAVAAVFLFLVEEINAFAQLRGKAQVGVSVSSLNPASSELTTKVRIVPTFGRVPSKGWGIAAGLNWFDADVDGGFVGLTRRLGTVNVRPVMAGVGYTAVVGRFYITPSVVAGPAWNRLKVDDDLRDAFSVRGNLGGDDFQTKGHAVTLAVRPGISATYAVAPRFGLTAFAGYLFNRPDFDVQIPTGQTRTPWKADGLALSAGVVVPVF